MLKLVKIVLGALRVMILEKKKIPENVFIVTRLLRAGCYIPDLDITLEPKKNRLQNVQLIT